MGHKHSNRNRSALKEKYPPKLCTVPQKHTQDMEKTGDATDVSVGMFKLYMPCWHYYNMCHVMFILLVYELTTVWDCAEEFQLYFWGEFNEIFGYFSAVSVMTNVFFFNETSEHFPAAFVATRPNNNFDEPFRHLLCVCGNENRHFKARNMIRFLILIMCFCAWT